MEGMRKGIKKEEFRPEDEEERKQCKDNIRGKEKEAWCMRWERE